ncbi:hypothetical protein JCM33374_g1316 [Metschnikowia sp. JCM 33374]|nr:hypothetical protein JCM33374_g1316 [Metschnikowia sp. JCM 33374]
MGRCITIITLTGATSLGLLTGSLTYQSLKAIPELIRQLNSQVSLKTASAESVLTSIKTNLTVANAVNTVLGALSTWLFSTAYRYSPVSGKHPYLVYSALGAPLALAVLYYKAGTKACTITGPFSHGEGIENILKTKLANFNNKFNNKKAQKPKEHKAPETSGDDESLDQSYIHISEDSSSGDSSPETPIDAAESVPSDIEHEVEDSLNKKERVRDLESVGFAYYVASVVSGVGFAICSVGVIGDQLFL